MSSYPGPTLVLAQQVGVPAAEVWAAWTRTDRLATWWWAGLPDTTHAVDPQVGGSFRVSSAQADLGATARFVELVEQRRLVLDWRWETGAGQGADDRVTVELREHAHGTLVVLTHEIADADTDTSMRDGWTGALTSLAASLEGRG